MANGRLASEDIIDSIYIENCSGMVTRNFH